MNPAAQIGRGAAPRKVSGPPESMKKSHADGLFQSLGAFQVAKMREGEKPCRTGIVARSGGAKGGPAAVNGDVIRRAARPEQKDALQASRTKPGFFVKLAPCGLKGRFAGLDPAAG